MVNPVLHEFLAVALSNLGIRLAALGRPAAALAATEEAVRIYRGHAASGIFRTLAEEHPSAYRSALARALANLGDRWSQLGFVRKGLALIEEAVGIQRELASANPAAFTTDLGRFEAYRDTLRAELAD
ncbi:tetratricopeptide repeat protein [Kitasatospora sp. Ki12]